MHLFVLTESADIPANLSNKLYIGFCGPESCICFPGSTGENRNDIVFFCKQFHDRKHFTERAKGAAYSKSYSHNNASFMRDATQRAISFPELSGAWIPGSPRAQITSVPPSPFTDARSIFAAEGQFFNASALKI